MPIRVNCTPFALLLGMCCASCSTTATIHHKNGRQLEVTLVGSDNDHIYFKTEKGASRLAKENVTDIDHPGDVDIIVGLLLSAYGVLNIAVGHERCDTEGSAYCVGVYAPLTLGVALTGFGLITYSESTSALENKVKVNPWRLDDDGAGDRGALPGRATWSHPGGPDGALLVW